MIPHVGVNLPFHLCDPPVDPSRLYALYGLMILLDGERVVLRYGSEAPIILGSAADSVIQDLRQEDSQEVGKELQIFSINLGEGELQPVPEGLLPF